jgi:hypothetical protein
LDEFNTLLEQSDNNSWIIDIVKLVIFHQSLPNAKDHMNHPILTKDEFKYFFDARLLELMKLIMVNDSASHSKFSNDSLNKEIINNLNNLKDYI